MYAHKHTYKYQYIRVYTRSEHCMNEILAFIIVYMCLYMIHTSSTWHIYVFVHWLYKAYTSLYLVHPGSSWFIP